MATNQSAIASSFQDAEADYYSRRLATAGLTWNSSRKADFATFVRTGKQQGWWTRIKEIYLWEGTTLAHIAVKARNGQGYSTNVNTTAGTLTNGDILANGGFTVDGLVDAAYTINFNTLNPLSVGLSFWLGNDVLKTVTAEFIGTGTDINPMLSFGVGQTTNTATFKPTLYGFAGNAVGYQFAILQAGAGFYHYERASSSNLKLFINGSQLATTFTGNPGSSTRSVALKTPNVLQGTGSAVTFYGCVDDGLMSAEQIPQYAAAVTTLMQALGRVVKSASPMRIVLFSGQSLSVGQSSGTVLSTTASTTYRNKTFIGGVVYPSPAYQVGLCPLSEFSTESPCTGYANQVSAQERAATPGSFALDRTMMNFGVGGYGYVELKKGTVPYNDGLAAITKAKSLAEITHTGATVDSVCLVHGEADTSSVTYQTDIRQWQVDYETDIKAITGQAGTIPMLHSQVSSFAKNYDVKSTYAMLAEWRANPTKTILVCPKYWCSYADGLHLLSASYRKLGEYYGQTQFALTKGNPIPLLAPSTIVRSGAVITVSFVNNSVAAPVGQLVLDDATISDPGNYGFTYIQTGGTPRTISSVALINSNTQVQITLSGDPGSPSSESLSYAGQDTASTTGAPNGGPTTGPRGCLRDSNTTVGIGSGQNLYNWLVHFVDAIST